MSIYIINRDDRPERYAHAKAELLAHRMDAIRFPAIITKPGWMGCRDSHLAIMDKCKEEKEFFILEDDILILDVPNYYPIAYSELPEDWDALYLGASPKEPQEWYSTHLYKLKNAHTTHAIVWHNRTNGAVEYILSHKHHIKKIDDYFATVIQPKFNCFVISPMMITQKQFSSDTCKKSDVSTIHANYLKFCV